MKATRFNFVRAVMALAAFAVVGFGFTGCQQESDPEYIYENTALSQLKSTDALVGTWAASEYEVYNIKPEGFDNGDGAWSYSGNDLFVCKTTKNSGYIYIKYTKALCSTHSDFSDEDWNKWVYKYDTDSENVGKWYAIAYKNLTANSVELSGAYGSKTSTETLTEAMKEFTIENGYFGSYSECTKQ